MTTQLTRLVVQEVSLVDSPANPLARVAIVKAKDMTFKPCDECKSPEQCTEAQKCMPEAKKSTSTGDDPMNKEQIEALQKQVADHAAEKAALEKRAADAEAALAAKDQVIKAKDDVIVDLEKKLNPPTPEDVLKALPEPVRALIEKQQKTIADQEKVNKANAEALAKMQEANEQAEWVAKAAEMKVGKADEIGALFMRIAKGRTTADDVELISTQLKALKAQATAGNVKLFAKRGADQTTDADALSQLDALAADLRKADPKLSKEAAIDKALEAHPELYEQYQAASLRSA